VIDYIARFCDRSEHDGRRIEKRPFSKAPQSHTKSAMLIGYVCVATKGSVITPPVALFRAWDDNRGHAVRTTWCRKGTRARQPRTNPHGKTERQSPRTV